MMMDEALRQFLESYSAVQKASVPTASGDNGTSALETRSPELTSPASAAGAQAAAEGTQEVPSLSDYLEPSPETKTEAPSEAPPSPSVPAAKPSEAPTPQPSVVAEEEVPTEEEEDWLAPLKAEELLSGFEDLQFLTNPREVLREVISRVDNHYRGILQQLGLAFQQLVERQLAWELEQLFYRTYPDLVGKEAMLVELVNAFSRDPRWQQLTVQQRMEVLARAARDRLKPAASEGAPPAGVVRTTAPAPVDEQYKKVQEFVQAISKLR